MGKPLRVLILEDSEDDALLLLRELKQSGYDVDFERVDKAPEMQSALDQKTWDLILSDFSMPEFNAPKALELLKASGLDLPFIIISGTIGEETAVAALKAGASDFLVKGKFSRLAPAIERELREAESRRERRRAEEQLRYQANLLSNVNDAIMASDENYRITYWNHAAESLYGWSAEEALGNFGPDITQTEFPGLDTDEMLRHIREVGLWRGEVIQIKKDGTRFPCEISSLLLQDEKGTVRGYVSINRDITKRKHAEEQAQLQIQRLRSLRAIDVAISSSFNLNLTLDILLDQVITQLNVDAAAILLFDATARSLEYGAGRGFRTPDIRTARVRLGEGYAGKSVLERRTIHVPNLMENVDELPANFVSMLKEEGFIDYYCVPLIVKGEVKGALEIFHRSMLESDPEWLDFLETLAGQAAIAIEDSTLFENLQRSNQELFQAYDATIEGWSHALDLRDKETEGHTQRVTELTMELARKFGFSEEQLINIRWGALLHDIGKMGVPDSILLKPDKLTEAEWEIMRKHPTLAFEMLSPIVYLKSSLDIPYCHHEKWDGSGYPRGLKGDVIPLAARLFAVVDVWDAVTSNRPYRMAWSNEEAIEYVKEQSEKFFDPKVVNVFLNMIAQK
ncbi:MAG TPA: HD domain-containing phosphohydrolase [Anaerolineales bacterium]|nr:HD domain-containing phosphohydrolase [Anaerolineales bacterium]